jgi:hypothetical protein
LKPYKIDLTRGIEKNRKYCVPKNRDILTINAQVKLYNCKIIKFISFRMHNGALVKFLTLISLNDIFNQAKTFCEIQIKDYSSKFHFYKHVYECSKQ